jgi:hypothetical protein
MAKKVVATLKKEGSVMYTRVIKMSRSDKSGAYTFEEKIINKDQSADFFKG